MRFVLSTGAIAAVLAIAAVPASAPATPSHPQDDPVLVRFAAGADAAERAEARDDAGVEIDRALPLSGLQVVIPEPGIDASAAIERLERSDEVLYAEPDVARRASTLPNDRLFGQLWGLNNTGQSVEGAAGLADVDVNAAEAWDLGTGSASVTVGIVDTGLDATHPDLAPNVWRNPREIAGNGLDDDANGFVDDARGWDFVAGDGDPADENGHGTHVAGTIGARGNDGDGVAGVSWNSTLLPLRALAADGSGRVSDVVTAYRYAARMGIRVVNASLGGDRFSRAERDALAAAPDTLFVVAAGNDGVDNDFTSAYPCNHDLANVLCVGAVDQRGSLAPFSNRGARTVDLAAPGVSIASTYPGGGWRMADGTSMASPHVAGAAALVWSRQPAATVGQVRRALLESARPRPGLAGRTVTGGMLDVHQAVLAIDRRQDDPPTARPVAEAPAPISVPMPPSPPQSAPSPAPGAPLTGIGAPAPALTSDRLAPRVTVVAARRPSLRTTLAGGLRTRISCSERCTLAVELVIPTKSARRLGFRAGADGAVAGRSRGSLARAGSGTVVVRASALAAQRLRRSGTLAAFLRIRAVDPAGNARVVRRSVTLIARR